MYFEYNGNLTKRSRDLRKSMTPEEEKLWYQFLRTFPVRILRQKVVENYILDFYCAKARLCIEIDGNQHLSVGSIEHDTLRSGKLNQLGITTIRFSNDQIRYDFQLVCKLIEQNVNDLINNNSK